VWKKRGDLASNQIWVKNRLYGGTLLLKYAQVFSQGEGGIGGPNLPYGALGSPQKIHTTSQFILSNFKILVSIADHFFYSYDSFVCAIMYVKHWDGAKTFNGLNRKTFRRFFTIITGISVAGTLLIFGKTWRKIWVWTRTLSSNDWSWRGKTFHHAAALIPNFDRYSAVLHFML
jgi:hypothetical protein